jgi:hypothetical protein
MSVVSPLLSNAQDTTGANTGIILDTLRWTASVGSLRVLFVFQEAFHVSFFAWLYLDSGPLLLGDRFLAKHTDARLFLSLFPHRRTPVLVLDTPGDLRIPYNRLLRLSVME